VKADANAATWGGDRAMRKDDPMSLEGLHPIIEVAVEMGFKVRDNLTTCFRTERHIENAGPSLFFNVARNTFLCKHCSDVGGDVIDFICQYKGWSRREAIEWLAHRTEFDRQTRELYYTLGRKKK
jgi:hypothetical protein